MQRATSMSPAASGPRRERRKSSDLCAGGHEAGEWRETGDRGTLVLVRRESELIDAVRCHAVRTVAPLCRNERRCGHAPLPVRPTKLLFCSTACLNDQRTVHFLTPHGHPAAPRTRPCHRSSRLRAGRTGRAGSAGIRGRVRRLRRHRRPAASISRVQRIASLRLPLSCHCRPVTGTRTKLLPSIRPLVK